MELRGRSVVIVGLARTGEALADFLLDEGARVTISDSKPREAMGPAADRFAARGAVIEADGHVPATFFGADLIIPSPGVPRLALILEARGKGVPVITEIELAYRFLKGTLIGITGTNGKSTTTTLIHKILHEAGRDAVLAGNIGTPLLSFIREGREDRVYVTEISSFQLEYIERFKVHLAVYLNLSPNHLDWHGGYEEYAAAKAKLIAGLGADDYAVLNADDAGVWALRGRGPFQAVGFSRRGEVERGAFVRNGSIILRLEGAEEALMPVAEIALFGAHNRENVMAAALAGRLMGVPSPRMRESIRTFRGLAHRLEPVLTHNGVEFVNDSKATTVEAAIKAVESFERPIVLILGGKDKGTDFAPLRPALAGRVRSIVLVGVAKDKIRRALEGVAPMAEARDYREVVEAAYAAARPGDVVLLAPACTSWDMFADFEQRGETFKREVRRLAGGAVGEEA
ncbi:MAG: UDP-N-acetylmuramoyl-L-alanine--D-glutamate ligase [Candidatus Aminicenantes bacterium]|nr:UDP-N-acetylmuramoyl-L-alanine--D-glutamate ligase [Candidatus Aminicenantes bacterium]